MRVKTDKVGCNLEGQARERGGAKEAQAPHVTDLRSNHRRMFQIYKREHPFLDEAVLRPPGVHELPVSITGIAETVRTVKPDVTDVN
jgi:hypothetical protein